MNMPIGNPSKINMKSIVHISDLHFGKPFVQDAGRAVLRFLEENPHDALICSGDIVQFAEVKSSWQEARDFFAQVAAPTVIVPGNHDVLRFFPIARWLTPMNRYFEYINAHRDMRVNLPGLDVVGLGTMRTWTIELGFITKQQLGYVEDSFKNSSADNFKVIVQHQSPKRFFKGLLPTYVRGYKRALKTYAKTGVDLILTGHNHFVHAEAFEQDGHTMVWSQSGTTTSNRFPLMHPNENTLTRIDIRDHEFDLVTCVYDDASKTFEKRSVRTFPRQSA